MPRIYRSMCDLMDSLSQALTAWAESERLNTLETEFAYMDAEDGD